jgi:hypothetical protein
MKRVAVWAGLLCVFVAAPGAQAQDESGMHHDMQMHHAGMHHAKSTTAKLTVTDDPATHTMTVRLGPLNLPAHSDHMAVAQPPDMFLTLPFDGWLVAFHPRLVDGEATLPGKLLHHVAFWNTRRPDFLCPNKEEHIFGAGGEMNDWPEVTGFGYRVAKGDRIRIETMVSNPTATNYPQAYLEVRMEYRKPEPNAAAIKSVYPVWFDVMECRNSGYDLKSGKSVTAGKFTVPYSGELLGVGGHLHDYGQRLVLADLTRKQDIATLDSKLDPDGRLLGMPIASFADRGGYRFERGEQVEVTATYDNPTGKLLNKGAMGIVVGYFLPDSDAPLAALTRPTK